MAADDQTRSVQVDFSSVGKYGLPAFANHVLCQHTESEFVLSFLYIDPPLAMDADSLARIDSVAATTVAKVVVGPKLMKSIVEIFSQNYNGFMDKRSE